MLVEPASWHMLLILLIKEWMVWRNCSSPLYFLNPNWKWGMWQFGVGICSFFSLYLVNRSGVHRVKKRKQRLNSLQHWPSQVAKQIPVTASFPQWNVTQWLFLKLSQQLLRNLLISTWTFIPRKFFMLSETAVINISLKLTKDNLCQEKK